MSNKARARGPYGMRPPGTSATATDAPSPEIRPATMQTADAAPSAPNDLSAKLDAIMAKLGGIDTIQEELSALTGRVDSLEGGGHGREQYGVRMHNFKADAEAVEGALTDIAGFDPTDEEAVERLISSIDGNSNATVTGLVGVDSFPIHRAVLDAHPRHFEVGDYVVVKRDYRRADSPVTWGEIFERYNVSGIGQIKSNLPFGGAWRYTVTLFGAPPQVCPSSGMHFLQEELSPAPAALANRLEARRRRAAVVAGNRRGGRRSA